MASCLKRVGSRRGAHADDGTRRDAANGGLSGRSRHVAERWQAPCTKSKISQVKTLSPWISDARIIPGGSKDDAWHLKSARLDAWCAFCGGVHATRNLSRASQYTSDGRQSSCSRLQWSAPSRSGAQPAADATLGVPGKWPSQWQERRGIRAPTAWMGALPSVAAPPCMPPPATVPSAAPSALNDSLQPVQPTLWE